MEMLQALQLSKDDSNLIQVLDPEPRSRRTKCSVLQRQAAASDASSDISSMQRLLRSRSETCSGDKFLVRFGARPVKTWCTSTERRSARAKWSNAPPSTNLEVSSPVSDTAVSQTLNNLLVDS
eukprot:CAMPEP_0194777890 /NCGR_PEP_ID=MMETSP0323_2-20130528/66819_1 /TAXON_ID=2866 ORGANISM="Crypthecodinium cohnii, Strain Seligo" /NCGR_SAMPLE_ID=MMETSP0323_2 /ASSEMBLY_ACC=CAM_ASM_000346 /LENGTH=122 /DNA_ID=CAMNT_0039714849 /DNA_START=225 /DNA_END=589 /DNA_ORIENTATION=+